MLYVGKGPEPWARVPRRIKDRRDHQSLRRTTSLACPFQGRFQGNQGDFKRQVSALITASRYFKVFQRNSRWGPWNGRLGFPTDAPTNQTRVWILDSSGEILRSRANITLTTKTWGYTVGYLFLTLSAPPHSCWGQPQIQQSTQRPGAWVHTHVDSMY